MYFIYIFVLAANYYCLTKMKYKQVYHYLLKDFIFNFIKFLFLKFHSNLCLVEYVFANILYLLNREQILSNTEILHQYINCFHTQSYQAKEKQLRSICFLIII